ncbi:MAG: glycosyl hydrolase family 28-related protein [Marinobacter sp.]|nr:glycosyl hydrolase family 28-related protein [Marinobacter sp.]
MTKYNTGNAVGSTDPRDLYDNAQVFDEMVNNVTSPTVNDRFGKARVTLANQIGFKGTGIDNAIEDYASGIELDTYNTIIRYSGEFYSPSASAALPYTTTATTPDSDPSLVSRGDAVLRQDLGSSPSGGNAGSLLVNGVAHAVSSRAAMKAYDVPPGTQFSLEEGGRSGMLIVKSGTPPSDPQEGIYVVLANGNYAERVIEDSINISWFGAVGDGVTDSTDAIQAAVDLLRTFPANPSGYQSLLIPDGDFVVSSTINFADSRYLVVKGTGVISADIDAPILSVSGLWLRFKDFSLIQSNSGSSSGCLSVNAAYLVSFEGNYMQGGDKVINHITGNNVVYERVSLRDGRINFYTLSAGNNTSNVIRDSSIESATDYNTYFGFNSAAYGNWTVANCYIEGNSTGQAYIENFFNVEFYRCYFNQLSSTYGVELDGAASNMRCKFSGCHFAATSAGGTVYAFRVVSSSIKRAAILDEFCRFDSPLEPYNTGDTYVPSLIARNPLELDIYNLSYLLDTAGAVDGFTDSASAAYTFGDPLLDRGERSINLTDGYVYKTIKLKAGVTYKFVIDSRNTGAGVAKLELFTSALGTSVASAETASTAAETIDFFYTPTTTAKFELLLRNTGTTNAEHSGARILSYETPYHLQS